MTTTTEQKQQTQATNMELVQRRNLKSAQAENQREQKEKYMQNLTESVKKDKYKTPKTEAQQKQALKKKQGLNARLIKMRKKKKKNKLLTKKYKRIIKKYQRTSWTLLYVAAFADAFFDLLTIPVISTIMSFGLSLYINIALWNIGPKKERTKRRLIRAGASTLDLIPIINWIPISVLIIYKAQEGGKRRVRRAKRIIKKLN